MAKPPVSATIITLNEESHLPKAIASLQWADEIVVVDSGSTDRTVEIAESLGAKVFHNPWPGYGKQKNFAQEKASHDWVLNVDADEIVPSDLAAQIQMAVQSNEVKGYAIPRKTFYLGRWIKHGGWYPNYLVRLANKQCSRWTEPNVHEALEVEGKVDQLEAPLHHYTFTTIEDQVQTNLRYSRYGFFDLKKRGAKPNLLKMLFKPPWKFFETYFLKRGFMDGLPGFIISINAAHSVFLKYSYFYEINLYNENSAD